MMITSIQAKSDATVVQEVELEISSPAQQLPPPLILCELHLPPNLCNRTPAGHDAPPDGLHELHTPCEESGLSHRCSSWQCSSFEAHTAYTI